MNCTCVKRGEGKSWVGGLSHSSSSKSSPPHTNSNERKAAHPFLRRRIDFCRTCKRSGYVISTVAWSSPAFEVSVRIPTRPPPNHLFPPAYLALAAGLARPDKPLLCDVPTFLASLSNVSSNRARATPRYRMRPAILQHRQALASPRSSGLAGCSSVLPGLVL